MTSPRATLVCGLAATLSVALAAVTPTATASAAPASGTTAVPASGTTAVPGAEAAKQLTHDFRPLPKAEALRTLNTLAVSPPGPMTGYSRDLFPHWRDASTWGWPVAPDNDCNARNAALYRDGTGVVINSSCTVQRGRWLDPYTAAWYSSKNDIDIDHVVPLAAAWRSGARGWTTKQRTAFANDKLVLMSVQDRANQAKGDKTPDVWKPANKASWCLYAQRWTVIKSTYRLKVASPEKAALSSMIGTCTR